MGMRTTSKGEASRGRLLAAAVEIFAAKGYHQAKISEIVKAAGLTQAAFYLYFAGKEAIYEELKREFRERLRRMTRELGASVTPLPPDEVPEQIRRNLRELFSFFAENRDYALFAFREMGDSGELLQELAPIVSRNMENNRQAGHLRGDLAADVAADCLVGAVDRVVRRWLLTGEKPPEELAKLTADFVAGGILKPVGPRQGGGA